MSGSKREPPPLPASLAERYTLERLVAMGGSAEVWRGIDRGLSRPVAVKILHRHLLADATTRARLTQEARAAAALSHPGIVAIYDVAVETDAAAIVLELVDGDSLAERIRRDRVLPPRTAARIGAEVAEALEHAHRRGVVHRDVKAANVLLGPDGEARLVDFGIARLLADESAQLTAAGTIAGTLRYLAPEQLRGEPAGPAVDVYATGVLLVEMLTGEPPYPVTTPLELAEAQQTPPLAIGDAPPPLAEIVRRTLDPDPARRPPSAGELAASLRTWLETDALPAPPMGASDEMTEPALIIPPPMVLPSQARGATVPPELPPSSMPQEERTTLPETAAFADRPRSSGQRRGIWPLVALAVIAAVVLFLAAAQPLDVTGPEPSASGPSTLTPSPSSIATATPLVEPPSLEAAVDRFQQMLDEAVQDGLIAAESAAELRGLADAFVDDDANAGDINRASRDLHRAIDALERDGEIGSDLAASLRRAVDDMQAAALRERLLD